MNAHPRLYASPSQLKRLRKPVTGFLKRAAANVARDAEHYLVSTELTFDPTTHNSLLIRAREMQRRVVTLLVRWLQTADRRYRDAAVRDVIAMGQWSHWGWEAWLANQDSPLHEFDLSYGENSATLAIAYDWLFDTLSPDEKQAMRDIAARWVFPSFLHHVKAHKSGRKKLFYFANPHTNWNTVCAGGAGMVALAMYEDLPDSQAVLELVEESIAPYLHELERTRGGWVEGIGYWGYGHRYGFMYLLSHSNALGRPHPLLKGPGVKETLHFPLDFCPNGRPCSFSDVNAWGVLAFHYAAAVAVKSPQVIAALDAIVSKHPVGDGAWPNSAELLVFHPRIKSPPLKPKRGGVLKHYPEMDWFVLADRLPQPRRYLSIRGGTVKVPHAQLDLLSFHCVIGDEQLITHPGINGGGDYLDTTFSSRRWELFETQPLSKNTILINGVGVDTEAAVRSKVLSGKGFQAIRLDATSAMGLSRHHRPAATRCVRVFVMLDAEQFVILDRVELPTAGRVESRIHTWQPIELQDDSVLIRGKREKLHVTYAADVACGVFTGATCPTTPGPGANVLRWCTIDRSHKAVTMATVLSAGSRRPRVQLQGNTLQLDRRRLDFSPDLNEVRWR